MTTMRRETITLPGATRESFIKQFLNHSPSETPALRDIISAIEGMRLWHKIIGSTGPSYLSEKGLAVKIWQEGQDRLWESLNQQSETHRVIDQTHNTTTQRHHDPTS